MHLAFGLSAIAHGQIDALDLAPVRAAKGVVAVIGPADLDPMPDCSPSATDEPLLAQGTVHYAGQPLFLVIATSHHAARRAARLAQVTITPLPAILTVDAALAANSRFEDGPVVWARGDLGAAFANAAHVIEGSMDIGGQEHFYLEGQVAAAIPQEDGMLIHSSSQHPTEIQHKVAHALHLPMSAVRVEVRRMGGGFGGKESQGNALAVACAVAARLTGRACKMRYDRDDDFVITGKRHDMRVDYRAAVDASGLVQGVAFTHLVRCGWSMDLSLPVADRAMLHADNCYFLPAVRIESHRLRTNTQSATAFRGFGGPQGMLGIERVMDHVAHQLGQDPLAIRRLNFYRAAPADAGGVAPPPAPSEAQVSHGMNASQLPPSVDLTSRGMDDLVETSTSPATPAPGAQTTHYHMPVEDFIAHDLVAVLERSSAYQARRQVIAAWNATNPILKKGIALTPVKFGISFTLTWLNQAGALVHVYQDGSIHLNHGGTDMGQGLNQKVAQVVADVFGVEPSAIRISATDTAKVPNTSATAASSGTDLNGMAARNAAVVLRDRLAAVLASRHQADPAEVVFSGGMASVAGNRISFADVAAMAYMDRVSLSSTGYYATPKITWDRKNGTGRPFLYFAYGAAVTEVVIDSLTGENRILRTDILHDTGSSLNPALDIGQIEGAYVQGAGWLTTEELVWDDSGILRTHAPSTYKIPAMSDRPPIFNVTLWGRDNREDTVGRSKAVGEPPLMLAISALMALSDAVAACGDGSVYPALDAPATPERVLRAVARVRAAAGKTRDTHV